MVNVKRRKGESFEALNRRFSRRVQQSGKVLETKKKRFYASKPSKTKLKASALRRQQVRVKRDYLAKIGALVEERRPMMRR